MAEELVDIVDDNNQVVDTVTRSEMRRHRRLHRATYILIRHPDGLYYVQRRTDTKDYCPGMLDVCAGGVLSSGEDYGAGALRELAEEMGIYGRELEDLGIHRLNAAGGQVFGGIYFLEYQGSCRPQPEEVAEVLMMREEEILASAQEFTPDSIQAFLIALDVLKNLDVLKKRR
ncbi:MAG: NUDIX hydrolase YfcD [Succinivibrionaceae bacterium]|nr:NUDIX hydrolase YfcD [Succinivibrionaceae bacterium]